MEPLQKISFVLLSQESAESKQIMYQLANSRFKQQDQLSISIIPFLSSVCDGWLTLFKLHNMDMELPNIENIPFDKLVKSTRVSYKLYSDKKHNKINNKLQKAGLERLALLKTDYNFLQKKIVKLFGQKDLGVFTLDGVPYGNTSQLSIYLEKVLDLKSTSSLSDLENNSSLFTTFPLLAHNFHNIANSVFVSSTSFSLKKNSCVELLIRIPLKSISFVFIVLS